MKPIELALCAALIGSGLLGTGCGPAATPDAPAADAAATPAAPAEAVPAAEAGTAAGETVEKAAAARPKWIPPVKGTAQIGYLRPVTRVVGKEVVTTLKLKNLSSGSVSLLRVDEYWYDKARNMLPGDTQRWRQPFLPGEVIELEFRVPRNPAFDTNTYKFSHANGDVHARLLKSLDAEE